MDDGGDGGQWWKDGIRRYINLKILDMFLNDTDYRVVVGESAFKAISQASAEIIGRAEEEAIEEVSGYLRPKYDVERIFGSEGSERNSQVVMVTVDVALYHMVSAMPQRLGYEIRETRYKRAIEWLEGVSKGRIVPDLPEAGAADGDAEGGGRMAWRSGWKRGNEW